MHELSLIGGLLDVLEESARENGIVRIGKVVLVVGESYRALPEALATAFEVLTAGTLAEGAVLEVTPVELVLRCQDCSHEYRAGEWLRPCPACGSFRRVAVRGEELYVDYYEGETEGEMPCG